MLQNSYRFATKLHRITALRTYSNQPLFEAFKTGDDGEEQELRYRTQKTPVIPAVQGLESRWNKLDAGQQDDIIAYLEDKSRGNWNEMSNDEKKATWFVNFGNWGPRSSKNRDMANLYIYVAGCFGLTSAGLALYKFSAWDGKEEVPGINYD